MFYKHFLFEISIFKEKVKLLWLVDTLIQTIAQKVFKVSTPNLEYLLIMIKCSCKTRGITLKGIFLELCHWYIVSHAVSDAEYISPGFFVCLFYFCLGKPLTLLICHMATFQLSLVEEDIRCPPFVLFQAQAVLRRTTDDGEGSWIFPDKNPWQDSNPQ